MLVHWIVALAALSAATASEATEDRLVLRLEAGAQAVITIDNQGKVHVAGGKAEPLSAQELAFVRQAVQDHPDAFGPNAAPVHSGQIFPAIPPNNIRFRFVSLEGGSQSLLLVENGSDRSYLYKARIGYERNAGPTDVCQIIPDKRSVEHWAYPLDWIEISDVRAVPYDENVSPRCE
jgi:hypothetical protein